MQSHCEGRVVVITGAAGGFGRLVAIKAAARGAKVVLGDIDEAGLSSTVAEIGDAATSLVADVTDIAAMRALAAHAVDTFGAIDVLVNNAGTMPLAFYADHDAASEAWDRCIDINIKGVVHGISAVHDQMISQGRGHVVNLSSIYGNAPVAGAAVYGATKAAVNVLSEALRVESQGRIKVTTVRPTGVPGTNLGAGIVNGEALAGIVGGKMQEFFEAAGDLDGPKGDAQNIEYWTISPDELADQILYAIDQPWGISIGDITVRASGEPYVL